MGKVWVRYEHGMVWYVMVQYGIGMIWNDSMV